MANVLLVGADEVFRSLLSLNLQRRGYRVRESSIGEAARQWSESWGPECTGPSLVIIDVDNPAALGEVELPIAAQAGSGAPPILLLVSGWLDAGQAERVGAEAWLQKPFAISTLLRRVDSLANRREQ